MNQETWTAVDNYISEQLIPADPVLDAAQRAAQDAGLPAISVSAPQGKFLHLLARLAGARRILEIGTLGGYSTIWLARALPSGGRLVSLEFDPGHAAVARANLERAGLAPLVEVRVGRALDLLPALEAGERFDFVFIDADKPSTPAYFEWALKLTRSGGVVVVDNVIRDGKIVDASGTDADVEGMRRFLATLAAESRASGTVIQTTGVKGYDGFALVVV
ncbi:MAG TPA: O-methyltransferase [Vicinamibacterales bacterium]|nr:O-methyltransferase [Vicinamibacterales bacterium]